MRTTNNTRTHSLAAAAFVLFIFLLAFAIPSQARAGQYIAGLCSPGIYPDAPEAGISSNSEHFVEIKDCGSSGLQVNHVLIGTATGTEQGRFGSWVLQAPAGTCISGGSAYSRLATENGIHGYLAVSPDSGAGVATENQNDDQLHLSAIPAGCWRYFSARLECTTPNENGRCVGKTPNAHAWVKQIRLQLNDTSAPTLSIGGSMFSGAKLRGTQTVSVSAGDQGAGLHYVSVAVNGTQATGDDLSGSCNLLPYGLVSRMSPCPGSFAKTYALNTEDAPFVDGANTVAVCVADFATEGTANTVCTSREVLVDSLCPASPVAGGAKVTAGFGNGHANRVLPFGKKSLLRGRVLDAAGNGVEGAQVCLEGHMALAGRAYHLIGTAITNQNGGWSWKLNKGASRELLIAYRANGQQVETPLSLHVRARARLHISKRVTRAFKRIKFTGSIPGPLCAERQVILKGSVPGSRRTFLVRHARTGPLCNYRMVYRFLQVEAPTKFDFSTLVPQQAGYPYLRGRSRIEFIKVRRCGRSCRRHNRHPHPGKHKHGKHPHHGKHTTRG